MLSAGRLFRDEVDKVDSKPGKSKRIDHVPCDTALFFRLHVIE